MLQLTRLICSGKLYWGKKYHSDAFTFIYTFPNVLLSFLIIYSSCYRPSVVVFSSLLGGPAHSSSLPVAHAGASSFICHAH